MQVLIKGISLVLLLSTQFALANANNRVEATFHVDEMTCATCPIAVKQAMQRVNGVENIKIDFDAKTAVVIYDGDVTNPKDIAAAASNVGFPTKLLNTNE